MAARGSTVIPCPHHRAAPVAIDWVCDAFGFARHVATAPTATPSTTPEFRGDACRDLEGHRWWFEVMTRG